MRRGTREWVSAWVYFLTLLETCLVLGTAVKAVSAERVNLTRVELRCRIIPVVADPVRKVWGVEIRRPSGELIREALKFDGETVVFKDLHPDIYVLCLSDGRLRDRCQSMDLFAPRGISTFLIEKEIRAPTRPSNPTDAFRISAWSLSIPGEARKELDRSLQAQLRGDPKGVRRHLERAVKLYPSFTEAWNKLGLHHHRLGEYARAVEHFRTAIKLDGKDYHAWINLAGSLMAEGKPETALSASRKAVELHPNNPLANMHLGRNHYYLRDFSKAKEYFGKAASLDPQIADAPLLYLARIAHLERNPQEEENLIRRFLSLHPYWPNAPELRRRVTRLSGDDATASDRW